MIDLHITSSFNYSCFSGGEKDLHEHIQIRERDFEELIAERYPL